MSDMVKTHGFMLTASTKKQKNTAAHKHRPKSSNLLDHINFFPSKEEGRIPGERKLFGERKIKQSMCQRAVKVICAVGAQKKCVL